MPELLRPYYEIILQEREWSWSLIGIAYMILGLTIRSWFMGPLARKARLLGNKHCRLIQKKYLKYSFVGWLLFLFSLALSMYMWAKGREYSWDIVELGMLGTAVLTFVLSVILHLSAFASAALESFRQVAEERK